MVGGMFSAAILKVIINQDTVSMLGTSVINGFPKLDGAYWWKQLILEFFGTFFLVMMVWMCAVSSKAVEGLHGMAIGGAVGFMAMSVPKDSALALNPARIYCPFLLDVSGSFGWWWFSYIAGELSGAFCAALVCEWFISDENAEEKTAQVMTNYDDDYNSYGADNKQQPLVVGDSEIELQEPETVVVVNQSGMSNTNDAGENPENEMELEVEVEETNPPQL